MNNKGLDSDFNNDPFPQLSPSLVKMNKAFKEF